MPRMLGLAKFGENAADAFVKTYGTMKRVQLAEDANRRAEDRHGAEMEVQEEQLEGVRHKRAARQIGEAAAGEFDALTPTPRTLGLAAEKPVDVVTSDDSGGEPGAKMPAAVQAKPTVSKHFYVAGQVADFHRQKGRHEDAQKVLTKAYADAIAENEARYNFELMPRMQKLRLLNLDADELKKNKDYQQLQWDIYQTTINNMGHIYGLMKTGNKPDAVRAFNASGVVMPGVQVADVRVEEGEGGTPMVIAYDKEGNVAKGKDGEPLARPQAWFERVWKVSQQQTIKLGKGDRLIRTSPQEDGSLKTEEIISAKDPADARNERRDELALEKAWSEAINKHRDDSSRYLKDTLGLTPNALGQIMSPDNQPLFEKALPKVTEKLQAARAGGKKLDQLDGVAIAKEALQEARDELKREKAGAGPRNQAPGGKGPTVKDIIGGG